jgi:hypothetical protein
MKRLGIALGFLSLVVLMNACKYSEKYQQVEVKDAFAIGLPSWMKQEEKLAPGAVLEYANRYRNIYVVGFVQKADTANQTFDQFTNTGLDSLRAYLTNPLVADSQLVEINGLRGVRVELFGEMTKEKIYFSEVYLQDNATFYHFSVWTRGEDRKLKYKEDIGKIIASIKPI